MKSHSIPLDSPFRAAEMAEEDTISEIREMLEQLAALKAKAARQHAEIRKAREGACCTVGLYAGENCPAATCPGKGVALDEGEYYNVAA